MIQKILKIFAVLIVLITVGLGISTLQAQKPSLNISTSSPAIENLAEVANVNDFQTVLRAIAQHITPGVVSIEVEGSQRLPSGLTEDPFFRYFFGNREELKRQQNAVGSGFIITPDGYLFSNWHVVKDASLIRVTLADNRSFEAKLIGADTELDIALLKIDGDDLPVVPIGDSDQTQVGDLVVAIGNPFGLSSTFTFGTVSGLGREGILPGFQRFIQSDVAVNPGNSGGPLLNIKGQAIGINTAIRSRSGGYEGISFAIPINIAYNIANQLFSSGTIERGFLGVVPQELDSITRRSLNLANDEGVLVSSLESRGPALNSGIQQGDIITKVDNTKISSPAQLTEVIASKNPKTSIEVEVLRNSQRRKIVVTLGIRPSAIVRGEALEGQKDSENPTSSELFKEVLFSIPTAQDLQRNGAKEGVIVTKVNRDSPLAFILSPGDIVAAINNYPTPDIKTFREVTKNLENSKTFAFAIYKSGYLVYRSIEF
ncbi:MAG: trypsin-like peptidase domain-containing protein [Brevinema sp.]